MKVAGQHEHQENAPQGTWNCKVLTVKWSCFSSKNPFDVYDVQVDQAWHDERQETAARGTWNCKVLTVSGHAFLQRINGQLQVSDVRVEAAWQDEPYSQVANDTPVKWCQMIHQ